MGERVLVIGGSGRIGRAVAERFARSSAETFVTCNSSISPETVRLERQGRIKRIYKADMTRADHARTVIAEVKPDAVIMLAAHPKNNPVLGEKVFEENKAMFLNVLDPLIGLPDSKNRKQRVIVGASTVLVTGQQDGTAVIDEIPYTKLPEPRENDYYVKSKIWMEKLLHEVSEADLLDTRVMRFGNVTGPGTEKGLVEMDLAEQVEEIRLGLRSGFEVFNQLAALDLSDRREIGDAIHDVLRKGANGETYNLVSGREILVRDLARMIGRISGLGENVPVLSIRNEVLGHALFSNAKLKALGWQPRYTFEQTVEGFYNWFVNQDKHGDMRLPFSDGYPGMDPWHNLQLRPKVIEARARYGFLGSALWESIVRDEGRIPYDRLNGRHF